MTRRPNKTDICGQQHDFVEIHKIPLQNVFSILSFSQIYSLIQNSQKCIYQWNTARSWPLEINTVKNLMQLVSWQSHDLNTAANHKQTQQLDKTIHTNQNHSDLYLWVTKLFGTNQALTQCVFNSKCAFFNLYCIFDELFFFLVHWLSISKKMNHLESTNYTSRV